ncbi:hypothetical protein CBR_g54204 [Chara braunii]|uniref:serine C-palmitoyltransferase n=1 Tax=Chara braunii TaxID=69332 RepID=A0A388K7A3_CHABU|nr:hypothetical protein CBR_g54204 [Chara braunii]|eukprot:GBG65911.1 hypothetical protein CBR_g54204 [Chara braunii]
MVQVPYFTALTTYFAYALLFAIGHIRDFFSCLLWKEKVADGYAPLTGDFGDFYIRWVYHRIHDCFNRPICSSPGAWIDVVGRERLGTSNWILKNTGGVRRCLNLGSYNYLGFAAQDEYCTVKAIETLERFGASTCSGCFDAGKTTVHEELENLVAEYLGKEDAIVYGMGFATNSSTLPALVGKGCLVISDSLNHSSIVVGVRGSGARVKVFKHNNPEHLEKVIRESIAEGQPRTHRPWKKILIVIEGVYSMEGEIARLPEIVAIKNAYKAYLYLDEAHSIGAMGQTGRGICEYTGVPFADVDILMGTFTKSFGSCGGYIAGSKDLITHLRHTSPCHTYATSMSPAAVQQVTSSLKVIMGRDGSRRGAEKLRNLRENSNWFRQELLKLGCQVLGDEDSPVIPIMVYNPGRMAEFSRECLKRHVAIVVVGFPACSLILERARFCISASHTRKDLEYAIDVIREVGTIMRIFWGKPTPDLLADVPSLAAKLAAKTQ